MQGATFSKPHFHYNPSRAPENRKVIDFAESLVAEMGQFSEEDCDAVINIGGDGTILRAFHELPDKPNFAVRPPESNSALFHGHHKIFNAGDLKRAFEQAQVHDIHPLRVRIDLSDGSQKIVHAFADVVLRSFNAQAVLSRASIDDEEPRSIMGCGWIIATSMGATALNETMGGKLIGLGDPNIVVTTNGVTNTLERRRLQAAEQISRIVNMGSVVSVKVSSPSQKRLTSVDFDSQTIMPDGELVEGDVITVDLSKKHIERVTVDVDFSQRRRLLINPELLTPRPFA